MLDVSVGHRPALPAMQLSGYGKANIAKRKATRMARRSPARTRLCRDRSRSREGSRVPCSSPRRENVMARRASIASRATFSRPASWASAEAGEKRRKGSAASGRNGFGDFPRKESHPGWPLLRIPAPAAFVLPAHHRGRSAPRFVNAPNGAAAPRRARGTAGSASGR